MLHVAEELESRADVQLPMACDAGVLGSQKYECLANQPHGVLSCFGVYLTFDAFGPDGLLMLNFPASGLFDTMP